MEPTEAKPGIPRALAHLCGIENVAADAAIAEALPWLERTAQSAALAILVQRGHTESLAAIVAMFGESGPALREEILSHIRKLGPGIRAACGSQLVKDQLSAIALIVDAKDAAHVTLLADGLRSTSPHTRARAAQGLLTLAESVQLHRGQDSGQLNGAAQPILEEELTDALARGLSTWGLHARIDVLHAAVLMLHRLEPFLRKKLEERRATILPAFERLLQGRQDAALAQLAWRGLALPGLESAAACAIERARQGTFISSLLAHGRLLADPAIRKGCRRIRTIEWLAPDAGVLQGRPDSEVETAIHLLAASGVGNETRYRLLRSWLLSGNETAQKAVLSHLKDDDSATATEILASCESRLTRTLAIPPADEVRRRRGGLGAPPAPTLPADARTAMSTVRLAFNHLWESMNQLATDEEAALIESFRPLIGALLPVFRMKLARDDSFDRLKALRLISQLDLASEFAEPIYRLCHDGDPRVRSRAVTLVSEVPGRTAERILRNALDDPDERVQANAIDSLERIKGSDRIRFFEPLLNSPSNRVRANAVNSLLRAGRSAAARTLSEMLAADSPAHRCSALWVADQLGLTAIRSRIAQLSREDQNPHARQMAVKVLGNFSKCVPSRLNAFPFQGTEQKSQKAEAPS